MDYYQRRPDRRGNYCPKQRSFDSNRMASPCKNIESSCPKVDINKSCSPKELDSCACSEHFKEENCGCMHEYFDSEPIEGCLERKYPVGIAYVPWQNLGKIYDLEKGFCEGTIFPELNLPFLRGGCSRR